VTPSMGKAAGGHVADGMRRSDVESVEKRAELPNAGRRGKRWAHFRLWEVPSKDAMEYENRGEKQTPNQTPASKVGRTEMLGKEGNYTMISVREGLERAQAEDLFM